jgi:acetyltransferase-like isoleucine patch superfamily enzyme
MSFAEVVRRVRRAETPWAKRAKAAVRALERLEIPAPRAVFGPLGTGLTLVRLCTDFVARTLFYQPVFRARCDEVGKGTLVYGGYPYLYGDLHLKVGHHCKLSAQTSLVAGHLFDRPTLQIGDHTNIGAGVVISVCQSVTLGSWVRVSNGVMIIDNPGHPLDAVERRTSPVRREQVAPVHIEDDVWIGSHAIILPGVAIGRGAIVAAGAVVTTDVEAFTVVAGNPARVVRRLKGAVPSIRVA